MLRAVSLESTWGIDKYQPDDKTMIAENLQPSRTAGGMYERGSSTSAELYLDDSGLRQLNRLLDPIEPESGLMKISKSSHDKTSFWEMNIDREIVQESLVSAAILGDLPAMEFLLDNQASIHTRSRGYSPIEGAIIYRNLASVEFLLHNGAIAESSETFCWALLYLGGGDEPIVRALLENRADSNVIYAGRRSHRDLLSRLPAYSAVPVVKLLVHWGIFVHEPECQFGTPLMIALVLRDAATVLCLLEHGANPNWKTQSTSAEIPNYRHRIRSPLEAAIIAGGLNNLRLLTEYGARSYQPDVLAFAKRIFRMKDQWGYLYDDMYDDQDGFTRILQYLSNGSPDAQPEEKQNLGPNLFYSPEYPYASPTELAALSAEWASWGSDIITNKRISDTFP